MTLYKDFDHFDMPIGADGTPYEFMEALRDEAVSTDTPIGWSERYGGFWVVTGWHAMDEIQNSPSLFSSRGVNFPRLGTPGERVLMLAGMDEPSHGKYRKLVQAAFSPSRAADHVDRLRADVNLLIDRFIADGHVDVVDGLTREVPSRLIAIILGLPPEEGVRFRSWVHAMQWQWQAGSDREGVARQIDDLNNYFAELLDQRRRSPGDDVLSSVVHASIDGERLTDEEVKDFFVVLLIGAIDNTIHLLANMLWRLSCDVGLRRRLIAEPDIYAGAIEEFLRLDGPAQAGRIVEVPTEIAGVRMKPGQQVQMVHPIANRDPRQFERPDVFVAERNPNRHFALGVGIHRCLGAHLVRTEARVLLEEFTGRIPIWQLDPDRVPTWSCGQVAGMTSVPIVFPPGGGVT